MGGFVIIVGSLLMADVLTWWLSARWLGRRGVGRWLRWLCHAFFGVNLSYVLMMVVLGLLGMSHGRRALEWVPTGIQAVIYVWHLFVMPMVLMLWLAAGVLAGAWQGAKLMWRGRNALVAQEQSPAAVLPDPGVSRRDFLAATVVLAPALATVGLAGYGLRHTWRFRINPVILVVAGLPAALDGLRIAQISDLHVGRWSTPAFLNEVVERTNALNADLVMFTGDLLDISGADLPHALDCLLRLKSRYGLYVIEGNHDLIDNAQEFRHQIRAAGLNFLCDSAAEVKCRGVPVQILGTPWNRTEAGMERDVQSLARLRREDAFPILLAHHPHSFDAAAAAGFPLTLSGHTHGGMIRVTRELNAGSVLFRYISGVYTKGRSKLLVSNGTGNWFPLRINAPAEIIHLTLRREA